MIHFLLNTIALDPNRWTKDKVPYYRIDQLVKPIIISGFHFLEIWQYHVSFENEIYIKHLGDQGRALGLSFPVVGMYPKLHLDGEDRRREIAQIEKILNYAKILGANVLKMFVGNISSSAITQPEYDNSLETMKRVISLAKSMDLMVTGETHQKTLFDNIDSCLTFMKKINADNFMICFQPYNLEETEQALSDYKLVTDRVIHVHYQGRKDKQMELLENSSLDYKKLSQTLIENRFAGYISLEFVKNCVVESNADFKLDLVLQNARRDRDYIINIGKDLGIDILH